MLIKENKKFILTEYHYENAQWEMKIYDQIRRYIFQAKHLSFEYQELQNRFGQCYHNFF